MRSGYGGRVNDSRFVCRPPWVSIHIVVVANNGTFLFQSFGQGCPGSVKAKNRNSSVQKMPRQSTHTDPADPNKNDM